jgi:hypothetical protein
MDGVSRLLNVANGNTSTIVSSVSRFAFKENEYATAVALSVDGFMSFRVLMVNVGSATAVDAATNVLMFVASANVTVMTRSAKFAACALLLVDTPVATEIEQCVPTERSAVCAVKVIAAPTKLESAGVAVNVVDPQLVLAEIPDGTRVKYGRTIRMASLISNFTLREKVYTSEVGAEVTGYGMVRVLCMRAVSSIAGEMVIGVELMSATPARATDTVRVFRSAA